LIKKPSEMGERIFYQNRIRNQTGRIATGFTGGMEDNQNK
jgi:hypothetical protein